MPKASSKYSSNPKMPCICTTGEVTKLGKIILKIRHIHRAVGTTPLTVTCVVEVAFIY